MNQRRPIKVLLSKVGLDGHDRGVKVLARMLRDAGMEVVYLGLYQTPEAILQAALDEDVDVIGVSCLSGEHRTLVPRLARLVRERCGEGVLLLVGGTIPVEDFSILTEAGVDRIFVPGTSVAEVVDYIVQACEQGRGASSAAGGR